MTTKIQDLINNAGAGDLLRIIDHYGEAAIDITQQFSGKYYNGCRNDLQYCILRMIFIRDEIVDRNLADKYRDETASLCTHIEQHAKANNYRITEFKTTKNEKSETEI